MKQTHTILITILIAAFWLCGCIDAAFWLRGCIESNKSSDTVQSTQQEKILKELTAQTGMPSIKNGRERKILKDIYELRDQDGIVTFTYIVAEMTGKLIFFGETIGYGIPAATQYTNPQKVAYSGQQYSTVIPQADPNGLFSPSSAEGTWVLMKDPAGSKVLPVYVEPRIIVSPFKLSTQ
jgi:uncharacterized membrane protein YciS (DUF1049 family)